MLEVLYNVKLKGLVFLTGKQVWLLELPEWSYGLMFLTELVIKGSNDF